MNSVSRIAITLVFGVLLLLPATGCGNARATVRTFETSDKNSPIATVQNGSTIVLERVDDKDVGSESPLWAWLFFAPTKAEWKYELTPGPHRLTVSYHEYVGNMVRYGVNKQTIQASLQANRKYVLNVTTTSVGRGGSWFSSLLDAETGETVAKAEH